MVQKQTRGSEAGDSPDRCCRCRTAAKRTHGGGNRCRYLMISSRCRQANAPSGCVHLTPGSFLFRRTSQDEGGVDDLDVNYVDHAVAVRVVDGGRHSESFVDDKLQVGDAYSQIPVDVAGGDAG